jgi:hypothetical protein
VDPPLGGYVDLAVDLPAGIAAIWLLGLAEDAPNVQASPFRFYFDLAAFVQVPSVFTLQERVRIPVPSHPSLRGKAFYAQPVQAPFAGQPNIPLAMPIGGGFTIGG